MDLKATELFPYIVEVAERNNMRYQKITSS